jgi:hypothetical protein
MLVVWWRERREVAVCYCSCVYGTVDLWQYQSVRFSSHSHIHDTTYALVVERCCLIISSFEAQLSRRGVTTMRSNGYRDNLRPGTFGFLFRPIHSQVLLLKEGSYSLRC